MIRDDVRVRDQHFSSRAVIYPGVDIGTRPAVGVKVRRGCGRIKLVKHAMKVGAMKIRVTESVEHGERLVIRRLKEKIETLKQVTLPLPVRSVARYPVHKPSECVGTPRGPRLDLHTQLRKRNPRILLPHEYASGSDVPVSRNGSSNT